jgi:DNA mismatch endonuclease Vsr
MTDTQTPDQRRATMRAVRSKDTRPEWIVRRLVHRLGYRYRLHVRGLPGAPDLVFPDSPQSRLRTWLLLARA